MLGLEKYNLKTKGSNNTKEFNEICNRLLIYIWALSISVFLGG